MSGYAVISREEAAKQQSELKPPQAVAEVEDAPKSAAPGSHPGKPIESDPEALAAYQGRDKVEARKATAGSWHENAFGQPVFVLEETSPGRRSEPNPAFALPEDREKPAEKPAAGRRG